MNELSSGDRDGWVAFLHACGLLYVPILLASICVPPEEMSLWFDYIRSAFPMAVPVAMFVLLVVMTCCANGFFDVETLKKKLLRVGLGSGAFAFIYLAGNSLGVKGSIWYFIHANVLLMIIITDDVADSVYAGRWLNLLIWAGHRVIGFLLFIAFLSFTPRAIWEALDYVVGAYFALSAWSCIARSRSLAVDEKKTV